MHLIARVLGAAIGATLIVIGLAACTPPSALSPSALSLMSVPPVYKLGLVAPFEGLHRPAGYAALAGLRAAIAECAAPTDAWIPLALDDSYRHRESRRALAKVRRDPATRAVLGPFSPLHLSAPPAQETTAPPTPPPTTLPTTLPTRIPFLIHADGRFASHNDWDVALAHYVQQVAAHHPLGAVDTRLLVAGAPASVSEFLDTPANSAAPDVSDVPIVPIVPIVALAGEPVALLDRVTAVYTPGDALLWLVGASHAQVSTPAAITALHARMPQLPILLGPDSSHAHLTSHFAAHGQTHGHTDGQTPTHAPVYWAYWANSAYTDWTQRLAEPASDNEPDVATPGDELIAPFAAIDSTDYTTFLFYRAACALLTEGNTSAHSTGVATDEPTQAADEWTLRLSPLQP